MRFVFSYFIFKNILTPEILMRKYFLLTLAAFLISVLFPSHARANEGIAEGFDLSEYLNVFMPRSNQFTVDGYGSGITEIIWGVKEGLTLNENCTAKCALLKDEEAVMEFPLTGSDMFAYIKNPYATQTPVNPGTDPDDDLNDNPGVTPTGPQGPYVIAITFLDTDAYDILCSQPGTYTIVIPAGAFKHGDELSLEFRKQYIGKGKEKPVDINPEYTFTPAEGEWNGNLETITLEIKDAVGLGYSGMGTARLEGPASKLPRNKSYPKVNDGQSVTWSFHSPTNPIDWVDGEYTLTIAKNTLTMNTSKFNGENKQGNIGKIEAKWTLATKITGIINGIAEAENYSVMTQDGIEILKAASRDELNSLDAGLYIINGRKVLIRN